jgi:hypothetical protein
MTPSVSSTVEGGSFTVTVFGDADTGSHLLGGAFGLSSDSALIDSMSWTNAAWSAFNTDGGYAGNGNYNEVIFGQLVIPGIFPPAPGSELGLRHRLLPGQPGWLRHPAIIDFHERDLEIGWKWGNERDFMLRYLQSRTLWRYTSER